MMQFKPWMIAAAAATVVVGQAWAAPAIQSITARTNGAEDVIRIQLSEPLAAVPTGFVVQAPARIAIDLPGVDNALGRSQVEIGQGNIRTANVVQSGDRTRLVLNLRQPTTYKASLEGNSLILVLDSRTSDTPKNESQPANVPAASQAAAGATHFAEDRATRTQAIRDIDFRRGADGSGRVLVELPSNQVGVDIRQQGQSLVVEFLRSALPDSLRRRFDVSDFGTPIQGMSATQVGDRVRLTVDPRGNWTHSAYQTDNQFVLEVRAQKEDPNKLTKGPGFSGEKLSLNFQNIEVRALLQVIADFTNFNVVTSDTVTGNVTLRLKDVPWDQALDIILQAKGLGVRKNGNVLWIAPRDEIVSRERADLEAKAEVAKIEPLRTQSFQLNYVKAEDIAKSLAGKGAAGNSGGGAGANASRILSPRGSVIFEQRTNQLFVNDTPSKLEEIQNLIAKVDIAVRQVMIEARIVEADERFGRSLGVKLGAMDLRGLRGGTPGVGIGGTGNRVLVGGTYQGIGEQTLQSQLSNGSFVPNSYFVNLPAAAVAGANPASVALSLFGSESNRFLNLEISALEADGRGRVVSSPRVITADQVKAIIEQGTELPYLTASSSGATTITFKKANLKLEVTPQITPEGGIILDVDVNKDNPGILTPAGFAIDTKHVQTQVLVENGGTVVIGGIYQQTDRTDVSKVPFIGDVPVLGNLFKSTTKQADKSELLIFLTPKVVSESQAMR